MKLIPVDCYPKNQGEFRIIGNGAESGTLTLQMHCPNRNSTCGVLIKNGLPEEPAHGWDGNITEPTVTPSIGCDNAPRCGWHGQIIKGVRTP